MSMYKWITKNAIQMKSNWPAPKYPLMPKYLNWWQQGAWGEFCVILQFLGPSQQHWGHFSQCHSPSWSCQGRPEILQLGWFSHIQGLGCGWQIMPLQLGQFSCVLGLGHGWQVRPLRLGQFSHVWGGSMDDGWHLLLAEVLKASGCNFLMSIPI